MNLDLHIMSRKQEFVEYTAYDTYEPKRFKEIALNIRNQLSRIGPVKLPYAPTRMQNFGPFSTGEEPIILRSD